MSIQSETIDTIISLMQNKVDDWTIVYSGREVLGYCIEIGEKKLLIYKKGQVRLRQAVDRKYMDDFFELTWRQQARIKKEVGQLQFDRLNRVMNRFLLESEK